jgi:TolB protein
MKRLYKGGLLAVLITIVVATGVSAQITGVGILILHTIVVWPPEESYAELYFVSPDGSESIMLANDLPVSPTPALSLMGSRVAFVNCAGESTSRQCDLYLIDTDGSDRVNLTPGPENESSPAWSPDGSRIAFARQYDVENSESPFGQTQTDIFIRDVFGDHEIQVTNSEGTESTIAWSHDGTRLAFAYADGEFDTDLYTVNVDGTALTQITFDGPPPDRPIWTDVAPQWSPDDSQIAFGRFRIENLSYIPYVVDSNGENLKRLIDEPIGELSPRWGPDGHTLAFSVWVDEWDGYAIAQYDLNDDLMTVLTDPVLNLTYPFFSSDGRSIAAGCQDGSLYVMGKHGETPEKIYNLTGRIIPVGWNILPVEPRVHLPILLKMGE